MLEVERWRSAGPERSCVSSSGRGERKTAGSKTLNGYAPERSGGRVQNGCVSRDAADTHGWRQPGRVCLGSAPAAQARSSSRFERATRTGLSIRENAGRAGMLEAATSWVAVAHANAASAKAGTSSATNIVFYGGKPQKLQSVQEDGEGGPASEAHNARMRSELAHNQ